MPSPQKDQTCRKRRDSQASYSCSDNIPFHRVNFVNSYYDNVRQRGGRHFRGETKKIKCRNCITLHVRSYCDANIKSKLQKEIKRHLSLLQIYILFLNWKPSKRCHQMAKRCQKIILKIFKSRSLWDIHAGMDELPEPKKCRIISTFLLYFSN